MKRAAVVLIAAALAGCASSMSGAPGMDSPTQATVEGITFDVGRGERLATAIDTGPNFLTRDRAMRLGAIAIEQVTGCRAVDPRPFHFSAAQQGMQADLDCG